MLNSGPYIHDGLLHIDGDGGEDEDGNGEKMTGGGTRKKALDSIVEELMRIRGVGEVYAKELIGKGLKSIDAVARSKDVPEHVRLCAKYIKDLEKGLTHNDAELLFDHIDLTLLGADDIKHSVVKLYPVGSYRRNHNALKDLDILLVCPDELDRLELSEQLNALFSPLPLFKGRLSSGESGYEFLYTANKHACVVEIYFSPKSEAGAALLYATGPMEFNILTRRRAKSMGMLLNQHGLFKGDKLIASKTEEEIFTALGLDYVDPPHRDDHEVWEKVAEKDGKGDEKKV